MTTYKIDVWIESIRTGNMYEFIAEYSYYPGHNALYNNPPEPEYIEWKDIKLVSFSKIHESIELNQPRIFTKDKFNRVAKRLGDNTLDFFEPNAAEYAVEEERSKDIELAEINMIVLTD